jgi:hypothetical protein
MMTEEQMMARLLAARLDKPPPPKPVPKPEVKARERWTAPKPPEAVAAQAAVSAEAFAKVVQEDSYEARRRQQEVKEMAEWNAGWQDPRARYQRELDTFWEATRAIAAAEDEFDYSTGYKERRHKATCHRGPGDPDWGL